MSVTSQPSVRCLGERFVVFSYQHSHVSTMIAKARGARRTLRLRGYGLAPFAQRGSRQVTVRKQIPSPWCHLSFQSPRLPIDLAIRLLPTASRRSARPTAGRDGGHGGAPPGKYRAHAFWAAWN